VRNLYQPALEQGETIAAFRSKRPWFDLGTPARYLDAVLATCQSEAASPISKQADVSAGAKVTESVVFGGARIATGVRVFRTIVGPGVELATGGEYSSVLLTLGRAPATPNGDSEEVIVTPLGEC